MPVFNVEKYIEKCIESVLNQTYTNFELIIINDGSTDKSVQVIQKFNDARIILIDKINTGVSDSRNRGIDVAKGSLVCFVDSDDFIDENYFEDIIFNFQNDVDLLVYNYYIDNLDNQEVFLSQKQIKLIDYDKSNPESVLPNLGYLWNKVYKLQLIKKNKIVFKKNISIYEDIIFNTEYLAVISTIKNCRMFFYHYVSRPRTSLVKSYNEDGLYYILEMNKALGLFLNKINMEVNNKNSLLSSNMMLGIKHYINSLFVYKKGSSQKQFKKLQEITGDSYIIDKLKNLHCESTSDKVYKYNLINSNVFLLFLICKIIK
jgi:glycosyltransferase involved in cell wall biosynthesis